MARSARRTHPREPRQSIEVEVSGTLARFRGKSAKTSKGIIDDRVLVKTSRGVLDDHVELRDRRNGAVVAILRGHKAPVWDAQFSPDGEFLVTASADSTARIWDVSRAKSFLNQHKLVKLLVATDPTLTNPRDYVN
jgi:WD40 repeat protein